jgi:hypothetical protein
MGVHPKKEAIKDDLFLKEWLIIVLQHERF